MDQPLGINVKYRNRTPLAQVAEVYAQIQQTSESRASLALFQILKLNRNENASFSESVVSGASIRSRNANEVEPGGRDG